MIHDNDVCKHCGRVVREVPKYYCPRSPTGEHEPVVTKLPGGVVFTGGTQAEHGILRGRGAFVSQYCQNKGWDIDHLTMEQLLEIRSQPEWKQPVNDLGNPPAAQEQMDAIAGAHDEAVAHDTGLRINLTPRGCTTPAGIERTNKAMREFEDATAAVATAAAQFFDEQKHTLLAVVGGITIAEDDRLALHEDLHQLEALIGARQRKQEAFLRAVAGVSEQN